MFTYIYDFLVANLKQFKQKSHFKGFCALYTIIKSKKMYSFNLFRKNIIFFSFTMMTKENIKRKYDLNSADILLQASNTDTPINSKLDLN